MIHAGGIESALYTVVGAQGGSERRVHRTARNRHAQQDAPHRTAHRQMAVAHCGALWRAQ